MALGVLHTCALGLGILATSCHAVKGRLCLLAHMELIGMLTTAHLSVMVAIPCI